ncbi:MAG: hypothetical protein NXI17_14225 [Alphaproteobacteria bacterium]|nr:hypothetical protein [Alphaproteobacteria bacterium]
MVRYLANATLCLIVAIVTLGSVGSIREFGFDSLGGRAFPRALAICLIVLALVQLARAIQTFRQSGSDPFKRFFGTLNLPPRSNIVVTLATVLYGLILLTGKVDFIWLSTAYVLCAGFLARPSRHNLTVAAATAGAICVLLLGADLGLGFKMIGQG